MFESFEKQPHYFFVDGIVRSLLPRLEEIGDDTQVLLSSESTLELIEYLFKKYEIDLRDLSQDRLTAVAKAMPLIIEDLERLDYSSLQPELFECAKAFALRVKEAVEERASESRGKVTDTLKG